MLKKISLYLMSVFYLAAGMNHFVNPQMYLAIIPPFLPAPGLLNALSGAAEMILAIMLIRPEVRSIGAWGVILLLIAVFPANVYMYMQGGAAYGVPDWVLLVRLPLQLFLIAWAFWHTKNPELDRVRIETAIEIDAPREKVWAQLLDFPSYPLWNPFIVRATGDAIPGRQMEIHIRPPGGEPVRFRNTILENRKDESLSWRGSFLVKGLFDGTHVFDLESLAASRTRLIHAEYFEGLLVGLLKGLLGNRANGFKLMNEALKARSES